MIFRSAHPGVAARGAFAALTTIEDRARLVTLLRRAADVFESGCSTAGDLAVPRGSA